MPLLKCDAAHEIKSTNKTFSELVVRSQGGILKAGFASTHIRHKEILFKQSSLSHYIAMVYQ